MGRKFVAPRAVTETTYNLIYTLGQHLYDPDCNLFIKVRRRTTFLSSACCIWCSTHTQQHHAFDVDWSQAHDITVDAERLEVYVPLCALGATVLPRTMHMYGDSTPQRSTISECCRESISHLATRCFAHWWTVCDVCCGICPFALSASWARWTRACARRRRSCW